MRRPRGPPSWPCQLAPLLLLLCWAVLAAGVAGQPLPAPPAEAAALQAFGKVVGVNAGSVARWPAHTDPCQRPWPGIMCNTSSDANGTAAAHVVAVCLSGVPLGGSLADAISTLTALPALTILKLTTSGLTGNIPWLDILQLSSLRSLNLSSNQLEGVLPGFLALPHLEVRAHHLPACCHIYEPHLRLLAQLLAAAAGVLALAQALDVSGNRLAGSVPAGLSLLSGLTVLSFSWNAGIGGPLPPSLGQLGSLQRLRAASCNFSGGLPAALFPRGSRLVELDLSSNRLAGPLPTSLANAEGIINLRLQGNVLSDAIPPQIGALLHLGNLELQGNRLTGPLPVEIAGLPRLATLDLRFNDLNGTIPQGFGNPAFSLSQLLLGHNRFSGSIPVNLGSLSRLAALDLSHNALIGTIPSSLLGLGAANAAPVQLDLAFNLLNLSSAVNSGLAQAAAFNCVNGSSTTCLRSWAPGLSLGFAVNAGGLVHMRQCLTANEPACQPASPLIFSADNTFNATVGVGTSANMDWVLEASGKRGMIASTTRAIAGTADDVLYQTCRISSDYLAYCGLGLARGEYEVRLHFAEIMVAARGLRLFDVILQGVVVAAGLDIVLSAGGPFRAHVLTFNASVNDGLLCVELYGRGRLEELPDGGLSGPMISALEASQLTPFLPPPSPPPQGPPPVADKSSAGQVGSAVGLTIGAVLGLSAAVFIFVFIRRKRKSKHMEKHGKGDIGPTFYSFSELRVATDNFRLLTFLSQSLPPTLPATALLLSEQNLLGEGGFGSVYKGVLPGKPKTVVAVKLLKRPTAAKRSERNLVVEALRNEVLIISAVRQVCDHEPQPSSQLLAWRAQYVGRSPLHLMDGTLTLELRQRNLLRLKGCCFDGESPILVCDFMPRGSLDHLLATSTLAWPLRLKIALGIARGLQYLHEDSPYRIIHRDVKPANILLDEDWTPKIADFGLARLFGETETLVITSIMGTRGYVAPEYALQGQLSDKVDVYSFGVVLLELVSGRPPVDLARAPDRVLLVDWTWALLQEGRLADILDPELHEDYAPDEVVRAVLVAHWCTQQNPLLRPAVSQALLMLTGKVGIPDLPARRLFDELPDVPNPFAGDLWKSLLSADLSSTRTSLDAGTAAADSSGSGFHTHAAN
eukprot:SM000239S08065  [mRNA]  locus=s239:43273:49262:+ [translate_table: standard]